MKQSERTPEGGTKVRRVIFVIAFTLTLIGFLAIGGGARPIEGAGSGSTSDTVTPAMRIAETPTTWPANLSDSSFGRLMPDGTYCGVGCPDEP